MSWGVFFFVYVAEWLALAMVVPSLSDDTTVLVCLLVPAFIISRKSYKRKCEKQARLGSVATKAKSPSLLGVLLDTSGCDPYHLNKQNSSRNQVDPYEAYMYLRENGRL